MVRNCACVVYSYLMAHTGPRPQLSTRLANPKTPSLASCLFLTPSDMSLSYLSDCSSTWLLCIGLVSRRGCPCGIYRGPGLVLRCPDPGILDPDWILPGSVADLAWSSGVVVLRCPDPGILDPVWILPGSVVDLAWSSGVAGDHGCVMTPGPRHLEAMPGQVHARSGTPPAETTYTATHSA